MGHHAVELVLVLAVGACLGGVVSWFLAANLFQRRMWAMYGRMYRGNAEANKQAAAESCAADLLDMRASAIQPHTTVH